MEARPGGRRASKTLWAAAPVWVLGVLLVAAEGAHEVFGLGGRGGDRLFNDLIHDAALWLAVALCLGGIARGYWTSDSADRRSTRVAWGLVALALAAWSAGETLFSLSFSSPEAAPPFTASDALWLLWYPLMAGALVLLVRQRIVGFEIHQWIDGIVVMLATAALWVAVFLEPVAHEAGRGPVAEAIAFAYPLGDLLLVGGLLGVFALMGWRPGRMWLLLGSGLVVIGVTDAASAVATLSSAPSNGQYDAAWPAGALLVASAAWQPAPRRLERAAVWGWRAIALPIAAQALGLAVQIFGYFREIAPSERLLTAGVLLIAMAQIVLTRPGRNTRRLREPSGEGEREPPRPVAHPSSRDSSGSGLTERSRAVSSWHAPHSPE